MPAPVMRNAAVTVRCQKKHLILESLRTQRPAVTEDNWLALPPIFEIDFRAVFGRQPAHTFHSFIGLVIRNTWRSACARRSARMFSPLTIGPIADNANRPPPETS